MAEKKTGIIARMIFIFIWLFAIVLTGSIILETSGSRVGQHNESTFGKAYTSFVKSWGGEISIFPANYYFEKKLSVRELNTETKVYEIKTKNEITDIIPSSIQLNSNVNLIKKKQGLINFNSFEVETDNEYILENKTGNNDVLNIKFNRPENANIIYDFTVFIDDKIFSNNINIDKPFVLLNDFRKNQKIKINLKYTTKGLDVIKFKLNDYNNYVLSYFKAVYNINTSKYNILRFGFPNKITKTKDGEQLTIDMKNFSTTQEIGISFISQINNLDQIQSLLEFSPVSLIMFILIVFILSQIKNVRFSAFHYLFIGIINVFYFLFTAYIIRFFNVFVTLGLALALISLMYLLYIPNITNKKFAFKILLPYHLSLTTILSLIFLLPIYRGIFIIVLLFIIFISIMIPIGKSNISKWPVLMKDNKK